MKMLDKIFVTRVEKTKIEATKIAGAFDKALYQVFTYKNSVPETKITQNH